MSKTRNFVKNKKKKKFEKLLLLIMTLSYDIDPKTKFVVLYQDANMKPTRISKVVGVPVRTIYDWIQKIENNIDIFQHQTKNFGQKIDDQTRMDIIEEVKQDPRQTSTRRLGSKYDLSQTAVHNLLISQGFEYRKTQKCHDLTEDEMEERVAYCREMLKYKGIKIKRSFFADEMGIKLVDLYKGKKLWVLPGEEVKIEKVDQEVKVNCWGAISWNGATTLHIFSQNLKKTLYQDIVDSHKMEMEDTYQERDFFYIQDNHPCHQNLDVFDYDDNIDLIEFPTYSPDLNPIENLWATLKYRVAHDTPKTEDELVRSLHYNWEQLTKVEILRPYLKTLEGRYRECIEKNGIRLPY